MLLHPLLHPQHDMFSHNDDREDGIVMEYLWGRWEGTFLSKKKKIENHHARARKLSSVLFLSLGEVAMA